MLLDKVSADAAKQDSLLKQNVRHVKSDEMKPCPYIIVEKRVTSLLSLSNSANSKLVTQPNSRFLYPIF